MSSIKFKLGMIFMAFFLLSVVGTTSVIISVNNQKNDGKTINLAGAQRMLTQKMSKDVFAYAVSKSDKTFIKIKETSSRFNLVLNGLINGDANLMLPAATKPKIVKQLNIVKKLWIPFYANIKVILKKDEEGDDYHSAIEFIKTANIKLLVEMNAGSAGFLCEAFVYLKNPSASSGKGKGLSTADSEKLQKTTFYGKEKKSLAYIIGIMNMILHGVEAPNIIHTNTLAENLADIQEKDRYDVILANPPFGGKERAEVKQNFPIKTGETASLFLQHFIKILKAGGKAGVVIKNTFLSNTDNASIALRKELLNNCNLHTVTVKKTLGGYGWCVSINHHG